MRHAVLERKYLTIRIIHNPSPMICSGRLHEEVGIESALIKIAPVSHSAKVRGHLVKA